MSQMSFIWLELLMKRRDFLQSSFQLFLMSQLVAIPKSFGRARARTRLLVAVGTSVKNSWDLQDRAKMKAVDFPGYFCTMNLDSGKIMKYEIPIFVHSFNQHPKKTTQALGVAKWTGSAIVVDIENGKVISEIKAPEGYKFFGHGFFDPEGRRAFITADSEKFEKGCICVYETSHWKLQKLVDIRSRYPHEGIWSLENLIVVAGTQVTKAGLSTSLVNFIDPTTFAVIKSLPTPWVNHVLQLDNERLVLSGGALRFEPQFIVLNVKTGEIQDFHKSLDFPKGSLLSEALSIAALSPSQLLVTLTDVNQLVAWDLKTNKLRFLKFDERTLGVANVGEQVYMTSGNGHLTRLRSIEGAQLLQVQKKVEEREIQLGEGRHLKVMEYFS